MLSCTIKIVSILYALLLGVLLPVSAHAKTDAMTIAMPADVIKRSIQDILPMKLDDASRHVEGKLYLHSLSKLVMNDNSAVVQGLIIGKDLTVITKVGNQDLRIKVGNLHLPMTCDLDFRFDAGTKTLYVKPQLRPPGPGEVSDTGNSVLSLLAVFNGREYPISLTSLKTLDAKVGHQDISLKMEPVDIRVARDQLVVKMIPQLSKTN